MYIPADVIGIWALLGLVWLLSQCRRGTTAPPPVELLPPPAASQTGHPHAVMWLRTYQQIAQDRGDWHMAAVYRAWATRLEAQQEADRQTANRALRTRIVGEGRAQDFE